VAEQERLAQLCICTDQVDWRVHGKFVHGLYYVAGVDVSFFPDKLHAVAAVVVLSYPDMEVVYERCAFFRLTVPYMVGFLAFREVPALKIMLEKIPSEYTPQAVLVDGNGVFHPRRCGSATHLGILTDLPTIGVAKEVLKVKDVGVRVASQIAETLQEASSWAPLVKDGDTTGEPLAMLLRPNFGKKTVVVSVGHKVSLNTAVVLTASLCKSTIPEPIRQADLRSRAAVRAWFDGVSLAKLKLGAGDLLDIAMANMEKLGGRDVGDEPATKRLRPAQIDAEGRNRGADVVSALAPPDARARATKKKGFGCAPKAKMVWRVKTIPSQAISHDVTHTVDDDALDGESTRTPTVEEDCSFNSESVLFDRCEDCPPESMLWRFLKTSLCGLCVVR
jgi:deoxyinosine 3'endonuclease (endonuclease V)